MGYIRVIFHQDLFWVLLFFFPSLLTKINIAWKCLLEVKVVKWADASNNLSYLSKVWQRYSSKYKRQTWCVCQACRQHIPSIPMRCQISWLTAWTCVFLTVLAQVLHITQDTTCFKVCHHHACDVSHNLRKEKKEKTGFPRADLFTVRTSELDKHQLSSNQWILREQIDIGDNS